MPVPRRLAACLFATLLALGGAACGDDAGEDTLGDGEVIEEGD